MRADHAGHNELATEIYRLFSGTWLKARGALSYAPAFDA
jgi:hypothetical protein